MYLPCMGKSCRLERKMLSHDEDRNSVLAVSWADRVKLNHRKIGPCTEKNSRYVTGSMDVSNPGKREVRAEERGAMLVAGISQRKLTHDAGGHWRSESRLMETTVIVNRIFFEETCAHSRRTIVTSSSFLEAT